MAYTSKAQIITRWGTDEVILSADRDPQDGVADDSAITAACEDASSLLDSYLARAGYTTPVNPVPPVLVERASDIAVYLLSSGPGPYTKEKRQRYEDALRWAEDLVDGKAELPGAPDESKIATGGRAGGFAFVYQAKNLRSGLL